MNKPERWSRMKHLGRSQPQGAGEVLERAKSELGPPTAEHQPQLQVLCPCEKCVEKNLIDIATEFNRRRLLIEGAPRKKTVIENIRRGAEAARYLADVLVAFDDYSRGLLLVPARFPFHVLDLPQTRAYKAAEGMHLPRPATKTEPASDGLWVWRLRELERYLDWRLGELTGYEDTDIPVDKGGNTNLIRERFGPPAWHLVRSCWVIFENCRPGEASGGENGPFLRFVNCVYEYATGEIEENSTLHNWIKRLARPLRHHDILLQKLGPLEVALDDLKLERQTPEGDARTAQLEADVSVVRQEVVDAFLALNHRNFESKS